MKEKVTGQVGQSALKVILLKQGHFHTYIYIERMPYLVCLIFILHTKRWLYSLQNKPHIIFFKKNFDLNCAFVSSRAQRQDMILSSLSTTSFWPRECPVAASTSFSDENYIIILFSEYDIGHSSFCLQHANVDGVDDKFKESLDDLLVG